MSSKNKGLTIPNHILSEIPKDLAEKLFKDGYGISFTEERRVQMRYMFRKMDLGGSYPLSAYGTWELVLRAAIKDNEHLRVRFPNGRKYPSSEKGVSLKVSTKKGRDTLEYSYQIAYKKADGKDGLKALYCGNENTMTTERRIHAEKTAWHLRRLYCKTLDPEVFSNKNTDGWQHKKLYECV